MKLMKKVAPWYEKAGYPLPRIRIGIGFPSTGRKGKAIGESWPSMYSADKTSEIFVHPGRADSIDVAATVVHELVHSAIGHDKKHGPVFKLVAHKMGLAGKMRSTVPSDELKEKLAKIIEDIGPFPHAALDTITGVSSRGPKQKNRMIKASCPECEYIIRASKSCLQIGIPPCPNPDCSLSYLNADEAVPMLAEIPLEEDSNAG
jgi:hypothetical protein